MPQTYGWIPAAHENQIFTSFRGDLTILNRSSGGSIGTIGTPYSNSSASSPLVANSNEVYASGGLTITRFAPGDMSVAWGYRGPSNVRQGFAINEDFLFVAFSDGLHVIDRSSGELVWKWLSPAPLVSNIVLTDSHAFVGTASATFAISLVAESLAWSVSESGSIAADGGFLFVSNQDNLFAFRLEEACPSGFGYGDVNQDGSVDLLDVTPFVDALLGDGFHCEADCDQSGTINLLDVAPFVDLIGG